MRNIKFLSLFLFAVVLALASCSENDDVTPDKPNNDDGETNVALCLSATSPSVPGSTTRAAAKDTNAVAGELMKNWIILVTQNNNIVKSFISDSIYKKRGTSIKEEVERDSVYTRLANGTYKFYTFANLSLEDLGLVTTDGDKRDTLKTLREGFDDKAFHVEGNQLTLGGFPKGIPMSNVQTVTIRDSTNTVDLDVIRMVAKVKLLVRNTDKTTPLRIDSLTFSEITKNPDVNVLNEKLFPGAITDPDKGQRAPNLVPTRNDSVETITYEYKVPVDSQNIAPGGKREFTFYFNESQATDASKNRFLDKHFTVQVMRGAQKGSRSYTTRQVFPFNDWSTMARNEVHVLNIDLTKYDIDFAVYPYTAIGVLPKSETERDIFTVFLGLYGHYDFVPKIRNLETGKCYYTNKTSARPEGYTVSSDSLYAQSNNLGAESDEIKIESMQLQTDANSMGIRQSTSDWGSNVDGSLKTGEQPHYPTVGWNSDAMVPRIECIVGNYTGWAVYTVNAAFKEKGSEEERTLIQNFRISNTYFDLSKLAKKHKWW